jgi:hypothetical protein
MQHRKNFWKGLMDVKDHFLERGRFVVHNGQQTDFWRDLWIGNKPLMKVVPSLYNLGRNKKSPLNILFQRALVGDNRGKWMEMVRAVLHVQLDD